MSREILSTQNKALKINLNHKIFGTLAEIGGGQEVARYFFRAGGSSGTIAKSISAYDKKYSDYLYKGKAKRYVSKERLVKMLDVEYNEVVCLLDAERGEVSTFFAFANTVETINFRKDNQGHGWLGIKFQHEPKSPPNQIIMHLNLIYAAYYYSNNIHDFLESLMDNLTSDRLEINMLSLEGELFKEIDNRIISLLLVKMGYTPASVFDRDGKIQQPSDMFYKKNIMLLRGSFRPPNYVHFDMLKAGFGFFKKEVGYSRDNSLIICEITLNNLLKTQEFNEKDYLDRVNLLNEMGQNVMVSNFKEFYKLVQYMTSHTIMELRLVLGANILEKLMDDSFYVNLKGGILEAMGRLFAQNVKLYVYPYINHNKELITSSNFVVKKNLTHLYNFLKQEGKILDIENVKKERLYIQSEDILKCIYYGDDKWKKMVPVFIAKRIEERKLFGCSN